MKNINWTRDLLTSVSTVLAIACNPLENDKLQNRGSKINSDIEADELAVVGDTAPAPITAYVVKVHRVELATRVPVKQLITVSRESSPCNFEEFTVVLAGNSNFPTTELSPDIPTQKVDFKGFNVAKILKNTLKIVISRTSKANRIVSSITLAEHQDLQSACPVQSSGDSSGGGNSNISGPSQPSFGGVNASGF